MINFIICNNDEKYLNLIKKIIENDMVKYDINYKCHVFSSYNEKLKQLAKTNLGFKAYILNQEIEHPSGIEFARKIREEYDDWCSYIVLTSETTKISDYTNLCLLDIISLKKNFQKNIHTNLNHIIKAFGGRSHCLTFEYNHTIHKIPFSQILMIEKEKDAKRCVIITEDDKYIIPKNLTETYKLLDKRFIKTSRSMIVNLNKIKSYNVANNQITFINNLKTHDISRENKKKLLEKVKCGV